MWGSDATVGKVSSEPLPRRSSAPGPSCTSEEARRSPKMAGWLKKTYHSFLLGPRDHNVWVVLDPPGGTLSIYDKEQAELPPPTPRRRASVTLPLAGTWRLPGPDGPREVLQLADIAEVDSNANFMNLFLHVTGRQAVITLSAHDRVDYCLWKEAFLRYGSDLSKPAGWTPPDFLKKEVREAPPKRPEGAPGRRNSAGAAPSERSGRRRPSGRMRRRHSWPAFSPSVLLDFKDLK